MVTKGLFFEFKACRQLTLDWWISKEDLAAVNPSQFVGVELLTVTDRLQNLIVLTNVKPIQANKMNFVEIALITK
jgi:hypothetical protein